MTRVRLIHWKAEEAADKIEKLKAAGYEVEPTLRSSSCGWAVETRGCEVRQALGCHDQVCRDGPPHAKPHHAAVLDERAAAQAVVGGHSF